MSFTITCSECSLSVEITRENVMSFVNEYGWNSHEFKTNDESPIVACVTYDTSNETVLCRCGHEVTR